MTQQTINILLLLTPLAVGGVIAAVNAEGVNRATEKAEGWARKAQSKVAAKKGWFYRWILNPLLWLIVKFCDWTDGFTHQGLKNGVRVALTLYLILAWCYLIYQAIVVAIFIAITLLVIYVLFKILINSNDDVRRGYDAGRRVLGTAPPGQRVNPNNGVVQKEGLLGWVDTDQRIDPNTGKIQTRGTFGWVDTDMKVDQETGIIQKEGLIGYVNTDIRINPETGIIQKEGLLGWVDTEERIDPETGIRQKMGFITWVAE